MKKARRSSEARLSRSTREICGSVEHLFPNQSNLIFRGALMTDPDLLSPSCTHTRPSGSKRDRSMKCNAILSRYDLQRFASARKMLIKIIVSTSPLTSVRGSSLSHSLNQAEPFRSHYRAANNLSALLLRDIKIWMQRMFIKINKSIKVLLLNGIYLSIWAADR